MALLALLVTAQGDVRKLQIPAATAGGRAPEVTCEYTPDFNGLLHLWVESEAFDPVLRAAGADGTVLGEDDDSGGGTTAFLSLPVRSGQRLEITVAAEQAGSGGSAELHCVTLHDTEETSSACEAMRELSSGIRESVERGDRRLAMDLFGELMEVFRSTPELARSEAFGAILPDVGSAAFTLQAAPESLELMRWMESRATLLFPPSHLEVTRTRWGLAVALRDLGEFDQALEIQQRVLDAFSRSLPEESEELFRARADLSVMLDNVGRSEEAAEIAEGLISFLEERAPERIFDLALTRFNLAATVQRLGQVQRAVALERQALEGMRSHGVADIDPLVLQIRMNLASGLMDLGDYAQARSVFELVVSVLSEHMPADSPRLLQAEANLANCMFVMGDALAARGLQESILARRLESLDEDHPWVQMAKQSLANTLSELGEQEAARGLLLDVLEARERNTEEDQLDIAMTLVNLAAVLHELGEHETALARSRQAERIFAARLADWHPWLQLCRMGIGSTLASLGRLEEAEDVLTGVVDVYERLFDESHPDLARARVDLVGVIAARGDEEGKVADLLDRSVRGLRKALRTASLTRAPREAGATARQAEASVQALLSIAMGWSGREETTPGLDGLFALIEEARCIDLIASRSLRYAESASADERVVVLRRNIQKASAEITQLAEDPEDERRFETALRKKEQTERELRGILSEALELPELDLAALAHSLHEGEAMVSFRRYMHAPPVPDERSGPRYIAFVVLPDGSLHPLDLGPAREIEHAVSLWRASAGVPVEQPRGGELLAPGAPAPEPAAAGRRLSQLVLEPLSAWLDKTRRLYVALDSALHLVPLDALPYRGGFLGDRTEVVLEPSLLALLLPQPEARVDGAVVAFGAIDYGSAPAGAAGKTRVYRDFGPLPETGAEVAGIAALFRSIDGGGPEPRVVTGPMASRESLFALAPGARVLHLATHGYFLSQPPHPRSGQGPDALSARGYPVPGREVAGLAPMTLCGLALAGANREPDENGDLDSLVTAEELASLDLSRCDLVCLSACDSGVGLHGSGGSIYSLQSAMHAAGAHCVVASLWRVDDLATRLLMERFYRRFLIERESKARALWSARTWLRDVARDELERRLGPEAKLPSDRPTPFRHPRYWAGWVLSGDPD